MSEGIPPKISEPDPDTEELTELHPQNANLWFVDQMFSLDMMGFDEDDPLEVANLWGYICVAL
jgi:hypothetical protein